MNAKKIIIYFLIAVVFLIGGFFGGSQYVKKTIKSAENLKYSQGWEEAKTRYAKICIPPVVDQNNMKFKSFSGKIKSLGVGSLTLAVSPIGFASGSDREIKVIINSGTKIKRMEKKSDADYNNELAAYTKRIGSANPGAEPNEAPPAIFRQVETDFASLATGQALTVTATVEADQNVSEITATEVLINYLSGE
jgi:hypothetical protein